MRSVVVMVAVMRTRRNEVGEKRTKASKLNPNRKGLYITPAGVPKQGVTIQVRDREMTRDSEDKPRLWRF